jgi:ribosome recycling factor
MCPRHLLSDASSLSARSGKMAEDARIAIRNERRDANKQIDNLVKDKIKRAVGR